MKRRFTLPVAHVNYEVVLQRRAPKCEGRAVQGYCDFNKRLIVVKLTENLETVRQVLWHEWHHALYYELGHPKMSENESLVEGAALALMRVRLEYPWL